MVLSQPILTKTARVWSVPSQKSQYIILGNQNDKLECDKVCVRILSKNEHPITFTAKIQSKKNGYGSYSLTKFIQIPQNIIPFMPEDIKIVDVEIIKLNN